MGGLLVGVLSCSSAANTTTHLPPTTTGPAPTAPSTSTDGSPVTTPPAHQIAVDLVAGLAVEIYGPSDPADGRAVLMLHGGGWYGGEPASMAALADYLASQGLVVFNATYRTSSGGYPESFDDVACDARYALGAMARYTSYEGPLAIVAHSAGAHLASVVTLSGGVFGRDCPTVTEMSVDRFVGLAGAYDPTLYSLVLASYFGTRLDNDPTPWEAGSPYTYIEEASTSGLAVLLIHGDADELVPFSSSELLSQAMQGAGYDVTLEVIPGATHADVRDPALVGDTIVDFIGG
jgi:acetyl esterase/lipase